LAEVSQYRFRVVADRRHADPLIGKLLQPVLQLHELGFAIGSPVGGAMKQQHRSVASHNGLKGSDPAVLVA